MKILPLLSTLVGGSALALVATTARVAADGPPRIFASSNESFAQGLAKGGSETIRESRKVVYFQEELSDLQLGYANYYLGSTGEIDKGQGDVRVKFALEYEGKYYPFQIAGQREGMCADAATLVTDSLPVAIKAGTYGAIRTWEQKVAPDPVSNGWLWSTEGDPAFNEGSVLHDDPSRDWTLGGSPGETAKIAWTVDDKGAISPTIDQVGADIKTKGVTIAVLDSTRRGSGFGYVATVTDGVLSGWFQQKAGSGYSHDIWVGAAGMGGYGAGGPKQTFGPSVITGTPTHPAKSVLLLGDSIAAGFGSSDKRGDTKRNFGIYARALSAKMNVCNTAIPGLTAYACDLRYKRTQKLIQQMLKPQVIVICLGTNDIDQSINDSGSKTPVAALSGHLAHLAATWAEGGAAEVWLGTVLPRVTLGADGVQTPKPGFLAGGPAEAINKALANGEIVSGAKIVDGHALASDPANPTLWRTDHGPLTKDGTHPSDENGIPWMASQLALPLSSEPAR